MLFTIKELSAWLNIKPSTLYLWAAQDKIPCQKIHGLIRFNRDEITAWLESFQAKRSVLMPAVPPANRSEINHLVEAAMRDPYTRCHGETISPSPTRKEGKNGAR